MTTARDLINGALRKINAVGKGAALDADEANDALRMLNLMLASWSAEGNLVFNQTQETFNLVSGQGLYTIGTGGNFNTARPNRIITAYVTIGSIDYPLHLIDEREYASIQDKGLIGTPELLYYDGNYPLGNIRLDPVPYTGTITLYTVKPLSNIPSLDTVVSLPGEYELAIESNLAVLMAPEYETEPSPTLIRTANSSKKIVTIQNNYNNNNLSVLDFPNREVTGNIYAGYE
jgi:hypothetical protein